MRLAPSCYFGAMALTPERMDELAQLVFSRASKDDRVLEHDGQLYYKTALEIRQKDGTTKPVDVVICTIDDEQMMTARLRAKKRLQDKGLELAADADLLATAENLETLAFSIRDPEPPHLQHVANGTELGARYGKTRCLQRISSELDAWTRTVDPRFGELPQEDLWELINMVARGDIIRPLACIDGHAQIAYMIISAQRALESPNAPSSLRSAWTSEAANLKIPNTRTQPESL